MVTPYEVVYESFMDYIIRDTQFFTAIPKEVSDERKFRLLKHAITEILTIKLNRDYPVNFMSEMNNDSMCFNIELTQIEVDIIGGYMMYCYISEEFLLRYKELKRIGFSDSEIKIFSPNATLKEFQTSIAYLKSYNENKVKVYVSRNRETMKLNRFDYEFN